MRNDYYDIAYNNLLYLEHALSTNFYNDIVVGAQQVSEKMLKSVLEQVCDMQDDVDKLLRSHNLRAIYDRIKMEVGDFSLDRGELSILKDYYFDAKYPGDNFVNVTREECAECLEMMYRVIEETNRFRMKNQMEIKNIEKKTLQYEYLTKN